MSQTNPKAVLISDIHFTVPTLELASIALATAMDYARMLNVPLVIAGDTLDSKAIIRGECANRLLTILAGAKTPVYMLVGNHDLLSEKSSEHSLNFLKPLVNVIESPVYVESLDAVLIPYMNSKDDLQELLDKTTTGSLIIMHQGVETAFMGAYVQDKTSLPLAAFANFRVISGHYHRAQNIKCGSPKKGAVGLFSYIGNPYSLSFAEAGDGPKGFQVLYDDGLMKQVVVPLRKHVIMEAAYGEWTKYPDLNPEDLLWLKVTGTRTQLDSLDKVKIGEMLLGHANFKLEKIYQDAEEVTQPAQSFTSDELIDMLIDNLKEEPEEKARLKNFWRELLNK